MTKLKKTDVDDNTKLFAFYGSLRKGQYNYARIIEGHKGIEYLGTHKVPGFELYTANGSYPYVVPSESEAEVVFDLFEIDNDYVRNFVDMMEVGAGYRPVTISIADKEAISYVMNEGYVKESHTEVKSGDWAQYLSDKAKSRKPRETDPSVVCPTDPRLFLYWRENHPYWGDFERGPVKHLSNADKKALDINE